MARILRSALIAIGATSVVCSAYAQSAGQIVEAGDLRLENLPQQELQAGHCSLFLWSKAERPVFILFGEDNPARATIRVNGQTRKIDRVASSGQKVLGQFEKQSFSGAGVAFEVDLTFDGERPVKDGAVIKTGVLRAKLKDGAEAVLPVGGMIGCKAA